MNGIRWTNCGAEKYLQHEAEIGCVKLVCVGTRLVCSTKNRKRVIKWCCTIYCGNKWITYTKTSKSLKLVKEDGEKLAIKYLFGGGFVILKALKRVGLLKEMLSEVGIDL